MSFHKVLINGSKLFIDPELEKEVEPLSKSKRAELKRDIEVNGIQDPLDVDLKTGRIYDGMNRYGIGQELKIKNYPVTKWTFENEDQVRSFVIRKNLIRRQQNVAQRVTAVLKLEPYEKRLAAARSKKGKTLGPNEQGGKVRDTLAAAAEVSSTTFHKVSTVLKGPDKQLAKDLLSGKKKPDRAYTEHIKKNRVLEKVVIPKGQFNLIVFDLPFGFDMELRGSPSEHYETYLTPEDYLKDFPYEKVKHLFAKNCIVVFWSWPSRTRDVQKVMDVYGVKEVTAGVWLKLTLEKKYYMGLGTRFRSTHENMIICEIGKPPVPDEVNRPKSVFAAIVNPKNHSEKPDKAYEILNRMYPTLENKLDFFGRKERPGFEVFGNQKPKDKQIDPDNIRLFMKDKPQKCPECGQESNNFEHNTYGRKCTDCYNILRKMQKENKGIITAQIYEKFQKEFGSKRPKVKKINKKK